MALGELKPQEALLSFVSQPPNDIEFTQIQKPPPRRRILQPWKEFLAEVAQLYDAYKGVKVQQLEEPLPLLSAFDSWEDIEPARAPSGAKETRSLSAFDAISHSGLLLDIPESSPQTNQFNFFFEEEESMSRKTPLLAQTPLPRFAMESVETNAQPTHVAKEDQAMANNNIQECLQNLTELDGFVGACLADTNSGMSLGSLGGGDVNLAVAAASNTEVVKAKRKAIKNLRLKETIEDILITLDSQYHIIRPSKLKEELFFYLVLDRSKGNLALARMALNDVEDELRL